MQYVLTRTQKLALVLLALLVLLAGWYVGIYTPIQDRIRAADTAGLEDEIALEQMKASKIKAMQAEIDENRGLRARRSFLPITISSRNWNSSMRYTAVPMSFPLPSRSRRWMEPVYAATLQCTARQKTTMRQQS